MSKGITRRETLKKAAYVAPLIISLSCVPAFASKGAGWGKQSSHLVNDKAWYEDFLDVLRKLGG